MKEQRKWQRIEIYYNNMETVIIYQTDLEKIEAIGDVLDGLETARDLANELRKILKE